MKLKKRDYLGMASRPESFLKLLPPLVFEDGLWVLADGSVGAAWRLVPAEAEAVSVSTLEEIYSAFEAALLSLPWDGTVSAQVTATVGGLPADDSRMRDYLAAADAEAPALARELGEAAARRLMEGGKGFWMDNPFRSRGLKVVFCLRFHPTRELAGKWLDGARRAAAGIAGRDPGPGIETRRHKELRERAEPQVEALEANVNGAGTGARLILLKPEEMLETYWRRLNPGLAARGLAPPGPVKDADVTFRSLAAATEPVLEPEGLDLEGWKCRALSLMLLPDASEPGMMDPLLTCGEDLTLSVGFLLSDKQAEMNRLEIKRKLAFSQSITSMGDKDLSQEVVKKDLDGLVKRLHEGRTALARMVLAVGIERRDAEAARRASDRIAAVLGRTHGAAAWRERHVGAPAWLSTLPFGFDPERERMLRREWSLPSDNLAHFLPLTGKWRGSSKPLSLFLNRDGDPVFLNPTEANVGHTVVAAQTGAGKSFLVNRILTDLLRVGARIFVIDIGGSYRRLCRLVGGRYTELTMDNPIVINPLAVDRLDDETIGMLVRIVLRLAHGDEKPARRREDENQIDKALRRAFQAKGWSVGGKRRGKEVLLRDLVRAMDRVGGRARVLAERMYLYHGEGRYARFFDRPDEMDLSKERFAVFDLKGLEEYSDLQGALLLALMGKVARVMASLPPGVRKVLVSDEAWALLKDPASAAYFEAFSRTARKSNGMLVCISQSFLDWLDNPAGSVILLNSPTKIYLQHPREALRKIAGEFNFSREEENLVAGLGTIMGRYSEFFVSTPAGRGVMRYVPSPFEYWTFTTDPADLAVIERETAGRKGDMMQAIRACAERYPYGVEASRRRK